MVSGCQIGDRPTYKGKIGGRSLLRTMILEDVGLVVLEGYEELQPSERAFERQFRKVQ